MKKINDMIRSVTKIAFFAVAPVFFLSSCEKDEAYPEYKVLNTIEINAPTEVTSVTAPVIFDGRILEVATKDIAKIQYYYILKGNDYAKRVVVESDFSRTESKTYFGSLLNVTVDGSKTDKNYVQPYNQYSLGFTIPIASYGLVNEDTFYVGVEVITTDGTHYLNSKPILIAIPEAD